MAFIDASDAGITAASPFIQQALVFRRPGAAFIEADLDAVMSAALLRLWIGEQQDVLRLAVFAVIEAILAESCGALRLWRWRLKVIPAERAVANLFVVVQDSSE